MPTIEELINNDSSVEELDLALSLLKPVDLAMLKTTGSTIVQEKLESDELNPFWTNKFNQLRIKRDSSFQFRDPAPQSKADFYCGYVLYLAAQKTKSAKKDDESYLDISLLKFNSFYALQEFLNKLTNSLKDSSDKEQLNEAFHCLSNLSNNIHQQKTPHCLLLANTYFYLASFYKNLGHDDESILCYQEGWRAIHFAQGLEDSSEKAIHNAYFGQGIKLSNAFGLDTIEKIKNRYLSVASEALPAAVRSSIELEVKKMLNPDCSSCVSTEEYKASPIKSAPH